MTQTSHPSLVVVGGGIVGLTIAVAAQGRGHQVTLVARDAVEDTASGVAAGMIAPAMEAMLDPDPAFSFQRLKAAQQAWFDLMPLWPESLCFQWQWIRDEGHSYYIWPAEKGETPPENLQATGAELRDAKGGELGLRSDQHVVRVMGDGQVPALHLLSQLAAHFRALGGADMRGEVYGVEQNRVRIRKGGWITADEVVVAAGYGGYALRHPVPSLKKIAPIKGHLLDLPERPLPIVLRAGEGYLASSGGGARFGATMQAGQDDLDIEPEVVASLKKRARGLFSDLPLDAAMPRTGIRASSPDGWPLIGRDPASGVLVATAMRRNGYIFAPLAAKIILALLRGETIPEGEIYRPDRF